MIEIRQQADTRQAYDEIFEQKGILLRDSFYLWLIDLLDPQPARTLLDISCGQGRLVNLAHEKGLHAFGVDFAYPGVRLGRVACPAADWAVGDGECLPIASGSMDYVTHIGSLEHYEHPARGAGEIARVLKPDGKACILLPNAFGLLGNIKYVWQHGEVFADDQPLQRYATRFTWERLLEAGGLRVVRAVGWGEIERPRTAHDLKSMLRRPQKILRWMISWLTPLNFSNDFAFLCTPAEPRD
jgi:SAM-dependent methyltransferase